MSQLHRWKDRGGQWWECDAYDHGPFCRLCRKIATPDETEAALLELVEEGLLEMSIDDQGGPLFRLTTTGEKAAAELIQKLSKG
jgi:hypothetical protein